MVPYMKMKMKFEDLVPGTVVSCRMALPSISFSDRPNIDSSISNTKGKVIRKSDDVVGLVFDNGVDILIKKSNFDEMVRKYDMKIDGFDKGAEKISDMISLFSSSEMDSMFGVDESNKTKKIETSFRGFKSTKTKIK